MRVTLSCKEVTRLVSQGEDRKLAFGERVELRLHFAICNGCRNVGAQLRFLRVAVGRLSGDGDEKSA
ncbi:MAG: zf-HC2 domain-containing protein [Betaproteobacteria bacterium]|nr:zf-HC2 domain-containing protein [Betaproteobacteria bacterium]